MDDHMIQIAVAARAAVRKKAASEGHGILNAMKANKEQLVTSMVNALNTVLQKAEEHQKNGDKGALSFISFSFLHSNLLLNRYAIRVDAWDQRFYIDEKEASADWEFLPLLQNVDFDFSSIESAVRKAVTRVQDYELDEVKRVYAMHYYAIAMDYLRGMTPICLKQVECPAVRTAPEVFCTIGPYMERQPTFYIWKPETKNNT